MTIYEIRVLLQDRYPRHNWVTFPMALTIIFRCCNCGQMTEVVKEHFKDGRNQLGVIESAFKAVESFLPCVEAQLINGVLNT